VRLDRIFLRPWWLTPWKRGRAGQLSKHKVVEGRPFSPDRRRVAVLSPYCPYPPAHGGAVRIFHLLREAARYFDILLYAFQERPAEDDLGPLLSFCSRIILVPKPAYREPRWSTLLPPEVCEYESAAMRALWKAAEADVKQVEYTALARYGGDVLVEHDVTFDLYRQLVETKRTPAAWWDWFRWRRFELRAARRFRRLVVMSDKDAKTLGRGTLIPNGVDLERFRPEPERPGRRLLFVGSFRHFPNVAAFRFFTEQVWPRLCASSPGVTLTVVAGPDPMLYWREATNTPDPAADDRIRLLSFVADVRQLYIEANLVIVPTPVSAGTNLKVLEAMAMERAIVSTSCGCAGLGLEHGRSVWIADDPKRFVEGIATLLADPARRREMAHRAGEIVACFDWPQIGEVQHRLYSELLASPITIRAAGPRDIDALDRIQRASPEAVLWEPHGYLQYDCRVAVLGRAVAGFVVSRTLAGGESEVLSLVVDPAHRRGGIAVRLMRQLLDGSPGTWFLEVRESNQAARKLYKKLGFEEVALRSAYYQDNGETAVVMRRQSC
jgi:ribosomal protein S18 acetylase RimI-like enzyme/glycosyltransferase involved in cell wall biosynthesis